MKTPQLTPKLTPGHCLGEETENTILIRLLESLESDPEVLVAMETDDTFTDSQDKKIAKLKVANRIYSLKYLGIFHVLDSTLTDEHLKEARMFIQETKQSIVPIAEQCLLRVHLDTAIKKVEKRISEVELILTQKKTGEAVGKRLES